MCKKSPRKMPSAPAPAPDVKKNMKIVHSKINDQTSRKNTKKGKMFEKETCLATLSQNKDLNNPLPFLPSLPFLLLL